MTNEIRVWKQFKFIDYYVFSLPHEIMFSTGLKVFNNNKLFGVGPKILEQNVKIKKIIFEIILVTHIPTIHIFSFCRKQVFLHF